MKRIRPSLESDVAERSNLILAVDSKYDISLPLSLVDSRTIQKPHTLLRSTRKISKRRCGLNNLDNEGFERGSY